MKVFFNYLKEHNLLINKWVGKWDMDDYKKEIYHFNKQHNVINIKYIIQDITELDFDFNDIELIDRLVKTREEIKNKNYKLVYITAKPQDVVFSHLYSEKIANKDSHFSCSTIEKALDLLQINMSLHDFKLLTE